MAKLTFDQRRELAIILEMIVDEDLLSDAISDLIAERDELRGKLIRADATLSYFGSARYGKAQEK